MSLRGFSSSGHLVSWHRGNLGTSIGDCDLKKYFKKLKENVLKIEVKNFPIETPHFKISLSGFRNCMKCLPSKHPELPQSGTFLLIKFMNGEINSCERLPYFDLSKRGTYGRIQCFLIDKPWTDQILE